MPLAFALGLAPAAFVAAYFYTLLRHDMLVRIARLAVFQMAERLLVCSQSLRLSRCHDIAPGALRGTLSAMVEFAVAIARGRIAAPRPLRSHAGALPS